MASQDGHRADSQEYRRHPSSELIQTMPLLSALSYYQKNKVFFPLTLITFLIANRLKELSTHRRKEPILKSYCLFIKL